MTRFFSQKIQKICFNFLTEDKTKRLKRQKSIEEIKLVRVAVSAFKKKRRLKDLKKTQKKANKFASVVEKVMHLREKEDKQRFYTASKIQRKKSLSSSTTSTTSAGSSSTTKARRPESVAQRVMRERQEKRISARNVVTPPKKKNKVKEPLHLALRKSASKHGPRAVMAQKIKQKAHFNAVSEFQVSY